MKLKLVPLAILNLLIFLAICRLPVQGQTEPNGIQSNQLELDSAETPSGRVSKGHFTVFENRKEKSGRILKLNVVVLHARADQPEPDPVFYLVGGPGQGAADNFRGFEKSWMRDNRDIVLVNQRGTGGSNRLQLPPKKQSSDLQSYLAPTIDPTNIQTAIDQLSQQADLRMYSTPLAMDDLNDVRQALGYEKINLVGGSYGTRAALVYIRRHGETVRTATLNGVAPIEFTNPLYHAQSAQVALDRIFDEVEKNETYRDAFPQLREKFMQVLDRFNDGPIEVEIEHPKTGKPTKLNLSREAFADSLRFQMYYMNTSRMVPVLIYRAYQGDFRPFVKNAISRNQSLKKSIAMGMLLCVTAAEDVARINPDDIPLLTDDTFLGDGRVRRQIEVCKSWPKSELAKEFGRPVKSEVPTLILSGVIDPVTPPRWGKLVAKNFPNSLHIVAPSAHGVGGPCIAKIQREFLKKATVKDLDTSCVEAMKLPPLYLPKEYQKKDF